MRRLGSASPAEQLEAARGLEQLAADPGGAQRIQRAGGVPALVRLLQGGGSEALQTAAATALCSMLKRGRGAAKDICAAGAGRACTQRLPSSRSPGLTLVLLELATLVAACGEQQLLDELAASPSWLGRLAQLATDPSQDPTTQCLALGLLAAGPMLEAHPSEVSAAVAPHAAALVQRLPPSTAAGIPEASMARMYAARLVELLADESAELAARMVAAGAVPRLVAQITSAAAPQVPLQHFVAVAALEQLVIRQRSAAGHLAGVDGVAAVLVQVLASRPPPPSCQRAWDAAEAATSGRTAVLLGELGDADAAQAGRAIAAGALPQLTRVLRWGAQRLEWQASRGLWEEGAEACCGNACSGLFVLLWQSGPRAVTSALQAELPQLVQPVLQHSRSWKALRAASRLLALLRDPGIQSTPALHQAAAELLRQLQPGGHPSRAAAIAALLSELTGEAQQRQAGGGSGAATEPARPSSSGAALASAQRGAAPAECAACDALPPAGRKFQVCAGCRAVRYCSPACQKAAWRSGHKAACRAAQGGA